MKKLADYTPEEVDKFYEIHQALTEYNQRVQRDKNEVSKNVPPYTDQEVMEYSRYRELLLSHQIKTNS